MHRFQWIVFILAMHWSAVGARSDDPPAAPAPEDPVLARRYEKAMIVEVSGPIFGSLKSYLVQRLEAARKSDTDLVILNITSPGGSLDDSEELARHLGRVDWATTIAYIPESAFSGAAIVSLGCDRIYMHPRALIGDAGPIVHEDGAFRFVEQKRVSAIAAMVHQLAEIKQRPGAVAEAMVDRNLTVYSAVHKQTGEKTYLTAHEIETPDIKNSYDIGAAIPESGQDRFLTVSGLRAVELELAEGAFESEQALLDKLQVEQIRRTRKTWVDQTVYVLNRPFVTGLLLLIGLIGLYVEMTVPGISVAGLLSLCCFGIFFWSHALGGTSGWLEVMLFALGVGALVVEIFFLPGVGVFGLAGVVMIVLSLVMASQDFVIPQTTVQWNTLRNNLLMVLGAVVAVVVALIVQITYFDWIPGLGRLRLEAPDSAEPASAPTLTVAAAFGPYVPNLGEHGMSDSVLRPAGKVRFGDHLVDVITEGDFLDAGTAVEVVKREGNRTIVRRTSSS